MPLTVDQEFTLQTLIDLVQINSVNPDLADDAPGEAEIGVYTADALRKLGLEVDVYDLGNNRVNVVGTLKGKGNGRSLLLNAHLDTVGVAGMEDPFGAMVSDGKLYGRGSQDMKGSLAAMLGATKALVDAGVELAGDLLVTAVADEEYESIGMDDLVKHVTADGAIVTEPTDMTLCRAHRGFIWFDVETFGRAAHGSRYQDGIDANMRMGRFLAELDKLEQALRQRPPHPLAGPPSLHASMLNGGSAPSIYSDHCHLRMERRTIPGETKASTQAELQAIIDKLSAEDPTFKATVKLHLGRRAFEVNEAALVVQSLAKGITAVLAHPPTHTGATFWTDAAILASAGIDTALIGPVGAGLHSSEEWVEVQSVFDLAQILAETAVDFCQ